MNPITRLWEGIIKEWRLVIAQRTAFALILVFPILVIAAFGGLYSNSINQQLAIAVFVDPSALQTQNQSEFSFQADFFNELQKNKNLKVFSANSREHVTELVIQNVVDGGVVIERLDVTKPFDIRIVVDSTDFIQSSIIWNTLSTTINQMTTDISVKVIEKIYEKILSQEKNSQEQLERVELFLSEFHTTKEAVIVLEHEADELDANALKQRIQNQKASLSFLLEKLNIVIENNETLWNTTEKNKADLKALLINLGLYPQNEGVVVYDFVSGILDTVQSNAGNQSTLLSLAKNDIAALQTELDELDEQITSVDEYKNNLKVFLAQTRILQDEIEDNMREARDLLIELNETIAELKKYSPQFLAKPTTLYYTDAISFSNLATLFFPIILSLVIMFTGMLLTAVTIISEKKQGVIDRLRGFDVGRTGLVVNKVLGQLSILAVEIAILLLAGVLLFGIRLNTAPFLLLVSLALVSVTFISLGFVIGSLSKDQSTAVLGVLVVALPLVFLSGALFPIELMPPGFQVVRVLNPLATAHTLFVNSLLKSLPLEFSLHQILNLVVVSLGSLAISWKKYL